jgi:hypothetical protein
MSANDTYKVGDPCPRCAPEHQGVWDGSRFAVCPVCGDKCVLDEKALEILREEDVSD